MSEEKSNTFDYFKVENDFTDELNLKRHRSEIIESNVTGSKFRTPTKGKRKKENVQEMLEKKFVGENLNKFSYLKDRKLE